jgi:hypothetical protein
MGRWIVEHKPKSDRPPLTQYELDLLATPTEELEKRTFVFSFDRDKFEVRISTGEYWQQLLQAHLYFDHVITQILSEALANPDAVSLTRMGFARKCQFILALNLLPAPLVSTAEAINGLRNKIAHDLNFEISDKDFRDIENCTPKHLREIAETEDDRKPGPLRFNELLRVVLFQIEVLRQEKALGRLIERKGALRLRVVLDQTPGVVYKK